MSPIEDKLSEEPKGDLDVYSFLDYRKLLKELYNRKKKKNTGFNYRLLAKSAHFSSPGFFTNILNGKRNISFTSADKLCEVFELNTQEASYFRLLVEADQAKNQTRRKELYDAAMGFHKRAVEFKKVSAHQFYEEWYYSAVREMIDITPFDGDYKTLAKSLSPSITIAQAKKSINLLESLGMIKKRENGTYEQSDPFITSTGKMTAANLARFHMDTADLAKRAIDKANNTSRNISTLTLGLSEEGYETFKKKIRAFRKELLELAKENAKSDRVYHLNFHLFPLSKIKKPKK